MNLGGVCKECCAEESVIEERERKANQAQFDWI